LRNPNRDRANLGPAVIEPRYTVLETLALASDQRAGGYAHVLENNFAGVGCALPEFPVHPIARDSRHARRKHEARDALVLEPRVRRCERDVPIRARAIRDEML